MGAFELRLACPSLSNRRIASPAPISPNGVVQTWGFDTNRSQLVTQTATKGANQLMNLSYSYDAAAGQSGVTKRVEAALLRGAESSDLVKLRRALKSRVLLSRMATK